MIKGNLFSTIFRRNGKFFIRAMEKSSPYESGRQPEAQIKSRPKKLGRQKGRLRTGSGQDDIIPDFLQCFLSDTADV